MNSNNPQKSPQGTGASLAQAFLELNGNEAASRLSCSNDAQMHVMRALKDMGQTQFINLTHKYDEGRIALALYAGDGIVTKIIPSDYLNRTRAVRHLPSITSQTFECDNRSYAIKTYPYLRGRVTEDDVEALGKIVDDLGLEYTDGDSTTRNVRRMPDQNRTLIGIDSSMFTPKEIPHGIDQKTVDAWHEYIHTLFPIYSKGEIPPQTADTSFEYLSIHDPNAPVAGFDHRLEDPIILKAQEPEEPEPQSFWSKLGI